MCIPFAGLRPPYRVLQIQLEWQAAEGTLEDRIEVVEGHLRKACLKSGVETDVQSSMPAGESESAVAKGTGVSQDTAAPIRKAEDM